MKLIIAIALFVTVHALPPLHPVIRYQSEDGAPAIILRHWEPMPDLRIKQTPNENVIGLNNLHQLLAQLANKINSESSNNENEGRPPQHILNYLKIIHELLNKKNVHNNNDGVWLTPINREPENDHHHGHEAVTPINNRPNDDSDLVTPIDHGLNNGLDHVTPINSGPSDTLELVTPINDRPSDAPDLITPINNVPSGAPDLVMPNNNGPSDAPDLVTPINDEPSDDNSEVLPIDTDDIEITAPIDSNAEAGAENGAPVNDEGDNEYEDIVPVSEISNNDLVAANDNIVGYQNAINDDSIDIINPDGVPIYLQSGNGNTESQRRLVDFMPRPIQLVPLVTSDQI